MPSRSTFRRPVLLVGNQDSLQRGLRPSFRFLTPPRGGSRWKPGLASKRIATEKSDAEVCGDDNVGNQDSLQRGLRPQSLLSRARFVREYVGNQDSLQRGLRLFRPSCRPPPFAPLCWKPGLASKRIATPFLPTARSFLRTQLETRTRFKEDCDRQMFREVEVIASVSCWKPGLASKRIATRNPLKCPVVLSFYVGNQDSLQRVLRRAVKMLSPA